MKRRTIAALAMIAGLAACGGGKTSILVKISPVNPTVLLGGTQLFSPLVSGTANSNVTWTVNGILGGNNTLGTIDVNGLYRAPTVLPNPRTVTVTATSVQSLKAFASTIVTLDSGIRVTLTPATATVGTNETLPFVPLVTGAANTTVTWTLNGTACGGAPSAGGALSCTGVYTAPNAAVNNVSVTATSVADINQIATATVTVLAGADPVLTSFTPGTAAEGASQLDLYLTGASFFSTSTVMSGGIPLATTFISVALLRARVPENLLQASGVLAIAVRRQNGDLSVPQPLTVNPSRPALVSRLPGSVPQASSPVNVNLTGGYYSPSTTVQFNGITEGSTLLNNRQLQATLPSPDLGVAGLFQLLVKNNDFPPGSTGIAATNFAVTPPASGISLAPTTVALPAGSHPAAVAINTATNVAVVVNQGLNTISRINLNTNAAIGAPIPVGANPTGVAVDGLRNLALVVNSGSNTASVVDLAAGLVTNTITLPAGTTPVSVGENPLTGHALVANQSTNVATVIDLTRNPPAVVGTATASTGVNPRVVIETRLDWAVVTPGGAGTLSVVDLSNSMVDAGGNTHFNIVATVTFSTNITGLAFNPETEQALVADPNTTSLTSFSLLDQSVTVGLGVVAAGQIAGAANPLTNVAVLVNHVTNQASVVDMRTLTVLATVNLGTDPESVAIDPASDTAVAANRGSDSLSIFTLGALRALHLLEISQTTTFTSAAPLNLTIIGHGFTATSAVRLDGTPIATVCPNACASDRVLQATVPAALLGAPRRFSLDVRNTDGTLSNRRDFTVIGSVAVGAGPSGVAIDASRDLAVVVNSAGNSVSIVDLNARTASAPIPVGTTPTGVVVVPRLGVAVVTNNGSNNVSVVDIVNKVVTATVNVGSQPTGLDVNQDTGQVVVADSGSNALSVLTIGNNTVTATILTDRRPVAVSIEPNLNVALVANTTDNTLQLVNLLNDSLITRLQNLSVPTGIAFDPVGDQFIVANSLANNLIVLDPVTLAVNNKPFLVGINPTSVAVNPNAATVVTVNSLSNTLSVADLINQFVRVVLPVTAAGQFAVAIHPRTNVAVVADQIHNRILLIPLPH